MENTQKRELIEFLGLFSYPRKQKNTSSYIFDKELYENDPVIIIIDEFEKPLSNSKNFNKKIIALKGKSLANKLKNEDKVKILLFFINCYHNPAINEIESEYEEIIFTVGESFGLSESETQDIIDFQLNDEPFNDKNNTVYFINKDEKINHKQICVNTISYSKDDTIYMKYLQKSKILISKNFVRKNISHYLSDNIVTENIKIIDPKNYNRNDFAYHSFEELIEMIENFNPVTLYELEATGSTPKIILDPVLGKIIISGKSSPLSPTNFFNPIFDWINAYKQTNNKPLDIYIILDYFNTYTSKFLMRLAQESKISDSNGQLTKLYWYCDIEDEDLVEFGEHLQSINNKGVEFCFINDELVA